MANALSETLMQEGKTLKIKFDIEDKKVKFFSVGAKQELIKQTKNHTLEMVAEAERVEAYFNTAGAQSEITPKHVKQTIIKSKTSPTGKHKWWYILCQIVAIIVTLFARVLFNAEVFKQSVVQIFTFIFSTVLALGCAIAVVLSDHFER